jgi:hypothetical protein
VSKRKKNYSHEVVPLRLMTPLVPLLHSAKTYSFSPKRKENNLHVTVSFWLVDPLVPLQQGWAKLV